MSTATSTTTSPAATATLSAQCADVYNIPVQDPAVGIIAGGNHTDIMVSCCGKADVISYYAGCGLYCLAQGQSVDTIIQCAYANGAPYQEVFYRGNDLNATATVTGTTLPTSASASVVATGGSTPTGSRSSSSASSTSSPGAAANVRPELGSVSTMGLTIGALLLSATAFGAFQL